MGCRAVPWREARTARPWARLPEWQLRPCNRTRTARALCLGRCTRPRARATSRPLARADAALDGEPAARDRVAGQSGLRALCCPRSCGPQRLAVEGITDRPNREIPNRKKTRMHTRLSCKIDYLLAQIIAID